MSKTCASIFLFFSLVALSFSQKDSISFLALGDSYTVGTSESKMNSWPLQFVHQSRKKKINIKTPTIIAKAGWTTTDLLKAIHTEKPKPNYDLVSLMVGVNNQYKRNDIGIFKKEFPLLLDQSIYLANGNPQNVIVLSIPDWSVTPFARFKDKKKIVQELDIYNSIIEQEAQKKGALFIEITKMSKNALVNPSLIASDSLHPSRKMYRMWVKKIVKKTYN
ncbi:SGNH/GDSL hydrolase family protein [Flagellimonas sp.]|uniref:SGNH/GDSL hydrolase family protein n=1 Tax=Flagellimonas sp. TaxID=2058762 RepID=UPI003B50F828